MESRTAQAVFEWVEGGEMTKLPDKIERPKCLVCDRFLVISETTRDMTIRCVNGCINKTYSKYFIQEKCYAKK